MATNLFNPDCQLSGVDLINTSVQRHTPSGVYGLLSGGHDSLTATHVASRHPLFKGVVHVNTGIGVDETREFVRQVCHGHGWPLFEYRAKEDCGQDYEQLVREFGFPGPAHHYKMYNRLKERCLESFKRDHKQHRHDRLILVNGCRSAESTRRMGSVTPIDPQGVFVWVAALHDWTADDCDEYMHEHQLPRNPVKDWLGMSGECLCGAFAKPCELQRIKAAYPHVAERIERLEREVRECGHDWGWEDRPPRGATGESKPDKSQQSLCWTCEK